MITTKGQIHAPEPSTKYTKTHMINAGEPPVSEPLHSSILSCGLCHWRRRKHRRSDSSSVASIPQPSYSHRHKRRPTFSTATVVAMALVATATTAHAWTAPPPLHHHHDLRRRKHKPHCLSMTSAAQQQQHKQQQLGSFQPLVLPETIERRDRKVLWEDWTRSTSSSSSSTSSTSEDEPNEEPLMEEPLIDFQTAWNIQRKYLQEHMDRLGQEKETTTSTTSTRSKSTGFYVAPPPPPAGTAVSASSPLQQQHHGVDRIIMLQHQPIYTLGTASDESFLLASSASSGQAPSLNHKNKNNNDSIPVIRMDRGGEVTYHGPGQLTVYPVIDLRHYNQDIHWYIRALEQAVLVALDICMDRHGRCSQPALSSSSSATTADLHHQQQQPYRHDHYTGVWVPGHGKVAAVGVKCRRWVTQHGVAINVTHRSLPPFAGIVPCGLTAIMTTTTTTTDSPTTTISGVTCVNSFVQQPVSVSEMAVYMKMALEEVFQVELV
jgi:lipoyl(octanoyl) transferase